MRAGIGTPDAGRDWAATGEVDKLRMVVGRPGAASAVRGWSGMIESQPTDTSVIVERLVMRASRNLLRKRQPGGRPEMYVVGMQDGGGMNSEPQDGRRSANGVIPLPPHVSFSAEATLGVMKTLFD